MDKEVRIAMAGLAHDHGTGFLRQALKYKNVKILGFFDNDNPANAAKASLEFNAPVYTDINELFSKGANTLLTARINADKPEYIIKALNAGIGVIADKPMATTLADLKKIEAAANKTGARIFLMLSERYGPAVYTAKKLIDSGAIGTVVQQYLVRPHRLRPEGRPDWMFDRKKYGGIINDIGVHDFDLARFFSGAEINRVLSAHVSNMRFTQYPDFCDNGMAMVEMSNGGSATVSVNWLTPDAYHAHGDTRFFIIGTRGAIDVSTVERTVRVCTDEKDVYFAEIETPPVTCEEDALAAMADPAYTPVVSTADGIKATRAALDAQALSEKK